MLYFKMLMNPEFRRTFQLDELCIAHGMYQYFGTVMYSSVISGAYSCHLAVLSTYFQGCHVTGHSLESMRTQLQK